MPANVIPTTSRISLAPTKAFFVEMLTRDIELEDAILDLLDNCVDGALRTAGYQPDKERPYEGYWAELTFSADGFSIKDNCGGIADSVRKSAFRLGRPPNSETDKDLPTVGTYGIGMKRAIFKLGYTCRIESHTNTTGFAVEINKSWLNKEDNWTLPVQELGPSGTPGTFIRVTDLRDDVRNAFSGPGAFDGVFRPKVAEYYSVLLDKGFEVRIGGKPVVPMSITLRAADLLCSEDPSYEAIVPYIYESNAGDVNVSLAVGFFSPYNVDASEEPTKGKAEEAGWTIVCNDRVVVSRDKTILTGWGDGAPSYHPQFRQIAGVVSFSSKNPSLLPINTTKRGIDAQNPLYLQVRTKMRDGLTTFTNFTNVLKEMSEEQRNAYFRAAIPSPLRALRIRSREVKEAKWTVERTGLKGRTLKPPLPKKKDSGNRRMVFTRAKAQIQVVSKYLFEDPDEAPSAVAAEAFDNVLRRAEEGE